MPGIEPVEPKLFQPERGLWIAPIRHHSPSCAWAVRAMIQELRPDTVLIEAPADMAPLIDAICDPRTCPPVAAVKLQGGRATYVPFCAHSPEYVAMQSAREIGATIGWIDLPIDRMEDVRTRGEGPVPLADETRFDQGAYIAGLCAKTGCRDGFELWDHLFEQRLGQTDWRAFLRDVGVYCAGLRATTPGSEIALRGDIARETAMSGHIAKAIEAGRVVAVVGGFHVPALTDPKGPAPAVPAMQDAWLIGYSHMAMDALAGYGAGLPQPGFYDAVWKAAERTGGVPDWRVLATDLVASFTTEMATQGHPVAFPAKVETLRMAENHA